MKLATRDIPKVRNRLSMKQKYECPICRCSLAASKPTLDHCHQTGNVRGTLCSTCNSLEGRITKTIQRYGKIGHLSWHDYITFLENMTGYVRHHRKNPSGVIHPTYDPVTMAQKPKRRRKKVIKK